MMERERLVLPETTERPDLAQGSLQFIGTATVLLRYAGFTILTDPNFLHRGDHVHLGYGLKSRRLTNPAMELENLPALDLVLLSHMHEDHFDRLVERRLDRSVPIVTTRAAAAELRGKGFQATHGLNRWESLTVTKGDMRLRITAMPGTHAPGILSSFLPPVMGSMLEFQNGPTSTLYRVYISGDTLLYDDLKEIPRRYPDINLGLFHLGGTRVMGLMVTMDANQGIGAIRLIRPRMAIPIHYNDYTVFNSKLEDFMKAVKNAGLENKVHYLHHGETYNFNVQR
jgi:L-ascorbate metabolism protein UlaG (beta-lactamase superfamily)